VLTICFLDPTKKIPFCWQQVIGPVFQAEVYAIRICVLYLCDEVNASIAICSDSQAALKALVAAKTTSQLVLETMKALMELSIHNCVRLLWVPNHSNTDHIVDNEEADKLAKQAAAAEYRGPKPALEFSTIAVRSKVRQWAHNEHNKYWFNTEGCRQGKELVTQVTPGLTQFALRQCHRDLRTLVYLLTGHNILNRHLTIMRKVNNPLCSLCKEEEETSLHFLSKCCATANICRLHFRVPFLEPGDLKQAHWITLLRFAKTTSSSSCMCFMSHNWSATKQRVAEISHHSVLSGDRIQQCETSMRTVRQCETKTTKRFQ